MGPLWPPLKAFSLELGGHPCGQNAFEFLAPESNGAHGTNDGCHTLDTPLLLVTLQMKAGHFIQVQLIGHANEILQNFISCSRRPLRKRPSKGRLLK